MNEFLKRAQALTDSMLKDRRWLHQHAEVGDDLPETSGYVMTRLREIGLEPREICPGGIVAHICGKKPGKTYLLRADMDALPMSEDNDLPFRSRTPNAHNCGHDIHTAMLLAAAQLLKEREDELQGCVKLMFQPNEEQFKGSLAMIRAGVLENPRVDACSAMHVMLDEEAPAIGWCGGYISSSCDGFKITVKGAAHHAGMPHLSGGVDATLAAAEILLALQGVVSRRVDPLEGAVVSVGTLHSGTRSNIISGHAEMEGTIRYQAQAVREIIKTQMTKLSKGIAEAHGAEAEIEWGQNIDPVINDEFVYEVAKEAALKIVDDPKNFMWVKGTTGAEDFGSYSQCGKACFLTVGTKGDGPVFPGHSPKFTISEDAFPYGAAMLAQVALDLMNKEDTK